MSKLTKALTAAAGNAGGDNLYVEDVFSTYVYTGTGAAQTITNDIDLDGEGGLVWTKGRTLAVSNWFIDTERGNTKLIRSDSPDGEVTRTNRITSFNSDGYSIGGDSDVNANSYDYVSWTFRKAEKFFDVVTYTGTGVARTIAHNLGSVPACMIIKRTDLGSSNWFVYHSGIATPEGYEILLNSTAKADTNSNVWNNTAPTDSVFSIGAGASPYAWNASGGSYVAYLFASDAGGFGDDGSESIIKCGSYTGNGSTTGPEIDLGFEPQFLLVKNASSTADWWIVDTMRGMPVGGNDWRIRPNTADLDNNGDLFFAPTATGFKLETSSYNVNQSGNTYIYIAIRRPMKTPESGTEVFDPQAYTGNGSTRVFDLPLTPDMTINIARTVNGDGRALNSRLTGSGKELYTNNTGAEAATGSAGMQFDYSNQIEAQSYRITNTETYINYHFKRATGFFDVVAFPLTNGVDSSHSHNLGVTPELILSKLRSGVDSWIVYNSTSGTGNYLLLNEVNAVTANSSVYSAVSSSTFNLSGVSPTGNYVSYLFASLAGVSKVGSYTGTGADLNVDCGFSAGARFILIKRTDSTGDWYVWDSVRGIVAGNDPYLLLNSTAVEVTSTDYIDPLASGFTVTSTAPAALNASGGTYIFLAIA